MEDEQLKKIKKLRSYSIAVLFLLIFASLSWNLLTVENSITEAAIIDANVNYQKDILFRRWNASHGGLYVPVRDSTLPNPYLKNIPLRDLVINDTLTLTLINPALMTRKIYELAIGEGLFSSRIISNNPLNPLNQADSIELIALAQLEQGEPLFRIEYQKNDTDFLKLVYPFLTEKPCLKCHQQQGYKVGDLRGGISFTLPLTRYQEMHFAERSGLIVAHSILLLAGLFFIQFAYRKVTASTRTQIAITQELEDSNSILQQVQKVARLGHFKYWLKSEKWISSEIFDEIFGISHDEEKNLKTWISCIHPEDKEHVLSTIASGRSLKKEFLDLEYRIIHFTSRQERWVRVVAKYIFDDESEAEFLLGSVQDITGDKAAERKLIESETRWRFAIDGSDLGLWDWDISTGKVYFSDRWKTMLGYTPSEIGTTVGEWSNRIHPDDLQDTLEKVKKLLAGELPLLNQEHRVLCKDGSFRWILDKGKVVDRDANGKAKRLIGTYTDIHDRKMLEFKLSRNQDLFVQGPTVVWLIDITEDLPVVHTTPNVNEQLGYASEVLMNSRISYLSLIHREDRDNYLAEITRYSKGTSASFSHEYRLQHANGHYVWINDFTAIIRDDKGNAQQLRAYLNDISDRKYTFNTLASAALGGIFAQSGDNSWEFWLNPDNTFRYLSPSISKVLGVPLETLKQDSQLIMQRVVEEDRAKVIAHHQNSCVSQTIDPEEIEFRLQLPDESVRWISHHCVPVFLEDGSFGGRRGVNRDITERKLSEEKVLAALKEKETLFKEVHHRVKNNFQIILSLLSLHRNNTESQVESGILQDIYSRIYAMALIHDLMHRPSQSGIKNYLNELMSYLKRSYIQVPDLIKVDSSFDDLEIGTDNMIAVGLIINELFSNSTKYAFPNGVSGSISVTLKSESAEYLLTYRDSGAGFVFPVSEELYTSSLGVKLIRIFTAQLRGTIINDPVENGMSITITFPRKL